MRGGADIRLIVQYSSESVISFWAECIHIIFIRLGVFAVSCRIPSAFVPHPDERCNRAAAEGEGERREGRVWGL